MTTWSCSIPGEPVAKGRPRLAVVRGRAMAYTPGKTAKWEAYACATLADAWGRSGPGRTLECPVVAEIVALFERPKRLVWKKRPMPREAHVSRPDSDNVVKAASDAIEKAAIVRNDSQIYDVRAVKAYCAGSEQPCVLVRLTWEATP